MNKNIIKYTGALSVVLSAFGLSSCDKGFKDLNVNPDAVSTAVPSYILPRRFMMGAVTTGIMAPATAFF